LFDIFIKRPFFQAAKVGEEGRNGKKTGSKLKKSTGRVFCKKIPLKKSLKGSKSCGYY